MGKGEIACTSNFSFSPNVFKMLLSKTRQKVSLCGNGLNYISIQTIAVKSIEIIEIIVDKLKLGDFSTSE